MSEHREPSLRERLRNLIVPSDQPVKVVVSFAFPWRWVLIGLIAFCIVFVCSWLVEHLSTVFIMLLVAGLLAFILDPLVTALGKRMPRWVAIVVAYVGLLAVLSLLSLTFVPQIIHQVNNLLHSSNEIGKQVNVYADQLNAYLDKVPEQLKEQIMNSRVLIKDKLMEFLRTSSQTLLAILGWVGKGMIMLVLSIYLLMDKDRIRDGLLSLVPAPAKAEVVSVVGDVLVVVRSYLRGQIVVIGFVAVTVTAALLYVQMPYALTIGTLAGILEVIPYFGAVVGAIPGVLFTFIHWGPLWGIVAILFFVAINQIEGHVVIPLVMGHNLEMRPLAVLLSLLVGAELGGIVGLIVAVPVARILQVFVEHAIQIYRDLKGKPEPPAVDEETPPPPSPHAHVHPTEVAVAVTQSGEVRVVAPPGTEVKVVSELPTGGNGPANEPAPATMSLVPAAPTEIVPAEAVSPPAAPSEPSAPQAPPN